MIVLIKGAGDIASGIAHRLVRSGFNVIMTEIAEPTMVRRTVSFGEAVYQGSVTIEGITARLVNIDADLKPIWASKEIPVIIDPHGFSVQRIQPQVLVDAILAKKNTGTSLGQAPLTIGLGPGFTAGVDVTAVIETMRGHDLGRVIYEGPARPNTGIPGEIGGQSLKRLLRAPAAGVFISNHKIGDFIQADEVVGQVNNINVKAEITGILRGLLKSGLVVSMGMKIGDIDPRASREHCYTISDKARAVAGGVLEAILSACDEKTLKLKI